MMVTPKSPAGRGLVHPFGCFRRAREYGRLLPFLALVLSPSACVRTIASPCPVAPTPHVGAAVQWGQDGDVLVAADYEGNGSTQIAIWRPSDGTWYISRENRSWSVARGATAVTLRLGREGDIPVPADYNGDGRAQPAVWRPTDGTWHILDEHSPERRVQVIRWGEPGDVPAPGDYWGRGRASIAVWRPAEGKWYIHP